MDGSIVPVLMGSNPLARGMYTLMADIVKYFPSPDKQIYAGINTTNNEVYPADYDFAKPKSAYIFKTIVDPYIGKYSLIKVNSGVLKTDDVLFNYHRDCDEKIGKLYVLRGNKTEEVKELHAGISVHWQSCPSPRQRIPCPYGIIRLPIFAQISQNRTYLCATKQKTKGMWIRFPSRCKNSDGRSDAACGK